MLMNCKNQTIYSNMLCKVTIPILTSDFEYIMYFNITM